MVNIAFNKSVIMYFTCVSLKILTFARNHSEVFAIWLLSSEISLDVFPILVNFVRNHIEEFPFWRISVEIILEYPQFGESSLKFY